MKQVHILTTKCKHPRVALFLVEARKEILLGVSRYVRQFGPWNLFWQPTESREGPPRWLARWKGEGIIGRITTQSAADVIRATGLPFVDVRGLIRDRRIPLVRVDDAAIGRMAAQHLLERSFRNLGFYGVEGELWSQDRRDAFRKVVLDAGGSCRENERPWNTTGPTGWEKSEHQLMQWLQQFSKPAGVFAATDKLGQRLLAAARRGGIRVPEQVAVLGADDERATCEICDPPLSSVIIDSEQQGYKAAELLDKLMQGEPAPSEPVLLQPPGIRVRQSTDTLAIDDPLIADAVRFIREHACEGIGVSEVLREVPLSRSVLQRRFRQIFGQTANDMIVEMRLKRARQLLIESDFPIARIAEMAGFQYQRYLGAVFKKKIGLTPHQYRQQAGPGRHIEL